MGNVASCPGTVWKQLGSWFPKRRPAARGAGPRVEGGTLSLADTATQGATESLRSVPLEAIRPIAEAGSVNVPPSESVAILPPNEPTAPVDLAPHAPSESSRPQVHQLEGPGLSAPTSEPGVEIGTAPSPPDQSPSNDDPSNNEETSKPALKIETANNGTSSPFESPVETTKLTISPEPLTARDPPPSSRNSQLQNAIADELLMTVPEEDLSDIGKASRASTETSLISPIQLHEFLQHVYPGEVFERLPLKDILQVSLASKALKLLVDDYLLNVSLPHTRLIFRYKTPGDIEYPNKPDSNYEHLVPVIKRVVKGSRVFPHNRIVYEPEKRKTKTHNLNKFQPDQIKLVLPEEQGERKITLALSPPRDERNHDRDRRDRGRRSHLLTFEYTKVHQYYRFDSFNELPIHIFYKDKSDGDNDYVELHCISIPLDFLRGEVLQNRETIKTRVFGNWPQDLDRDRDLGATSGQSLE
jgi:hypothetical protein